MASKHFIEEKVYSGNFDISQGQTQFRESYNILFSPNGSAKISKKYYYSHDSERDTHYETTEADINYLGKYEILSEEYDVNVISIHLTKRTGKIKKIDSYIGNLPDEDFINQNIDKKFELIERKDCDSVKFTHGNFFYIFEDKPDKIFYKFNLNLFQEEV